jgi:hypothetical protein
VLVAAAFCPQPPLLVPELAAGAAAELAALRAACDGAVRALVAAGADRAVVLGAGEQACYYPGGCGDLGGYGVPVRVRLGEPDQAGTALPLPLPLPLTIGAWLLARSAPGLPAVGVTADPAGGCPPVDWSGSVGLLVMGDGSARREAGSPGAADPRGVPFDRAVAAALASGDPARLRALDPALGADLLAAGTPAWVAAGAALDGTAYTPEIRYDAAPYGVGYLVATWIPA